MWHRDGTGSAEGSDACVIVARVKICKLTIQGWVGELTISVMVL